MSEKDLLKWLKRQLLDIHMPDEEPKPLCRLDLVHTIEGEGFEKLESFRVTDDSDPETLANDLFGAAEHDASTRTSGNVQRYVVLAFRDNSERATHDSSHSFVIQTSTAMRLIGADTTSPTEKGFQAQFMRHNEAMHRLMLQGAEATIGRVAGELQRETDRRIAAEARNDKLKEREEELLDRKYERELDRAVKLQQAKFFTELGGMVTSMLPLIAGKLLAGKEAVVAPNARDLAIQNFLKTLEPTQFEGIIKALKPPQQIALMELYMSYAESVKKDEAKKEEMLRDVPQEEAQQEAR